MASRLAAVLLLLPIALAMPPTADDNKHVIQTGGSVRITLDSRSESCQGDANSCQCCCEKMHPIDSESLTNCELASVWMTDGKCPPTFAHSTPSASCSLAPTDPWPRGAAEPWPATNAACSNETTVDDLYTLCHLSECDNGPVESCECLDRYINHCVMVNAGIGVKEPCTFTREMARVYQQRLKCNAQPTCPKPAYLPNSPLKDDCPDDSDIGTTCSLSCAPGFAPRVNTSSSAQLECTANGWVVADGELRCEEATYCTVPIHVKKDKGVAHDCEDIAPVGTECHMSCKPGYYSSQPSFDRITAKCVASLDNTAEYDNSISCTPVYCPTTIIPQGVRHDCPETGAPGTHCTLSCPEGYSGKAITATCVGHGGKGGVQTYSEYEFGDLTCTQLAGKTEAVLAGLKLRVGTENLTLAAEVTPRFDPGRVEYAVSVPFRHTHAILALERSSALAVDVLCDYCRGHHGSGNDHTLKLQEGLNTISIAVTSKDDAAVTKTYTLRVVRAKHQHDEGMNPIVLLKAAIRMEADYSPAWEEMHGAGATEALASVLGLEDDQVAIAAVVSGSVIVYYDIKVRSRDTYLGTAPLFDKAVASGQLASQMCTRTGVCVPTVSVVEGYMPAPFQPSASPKPSPSPTNTSKPMPSQLPLCTSPLAQECVRMFVERGCDKLVTKEKTCTATVECQMEAKKSTQCTDRCRTGAALNCVKDMLASKCKLQTEGTCGYFVDCQRQARVTAGDKCPVVNPWLLLHPECTTGDAEVCVTKFLHSGCQKLDMTGNCHNHVTCQIHAMNNPHSGCPVVTSHLTDSVALLWMHYMMLYRFHDLLHEANPELWLRLGMDTYPTFFM